MKLRMIAVALAALFGLTGALGAYLFRPAAAPSGPVQPVALEAAGRGASTAPSGRRFQIRPDESEARFVVDEILRGTPTTVVGTTNQVAGQIAVDPDDLDAAQVGTITVNARGLATDSGSRNRMLQNQILQTDQHEYIAFRPTELVGLPGRARLGEAIPFRIVGDLTIKGVTREVTFDATLTPASSDRLVGDASTTIRYADWGISIPQVPAVAGVNEVVQLQLRFVATAAS